MEKIKQFWKKIPKAGKICIGALILILFCVTYLVRRSAPLDRIRLYEVSVKPLEDGALEIRYHLNWTVKNDRREGPLLNVRIGMANYNYELIGAGGDILKEQRRSDSDRESGDAAMAGGKDGGWLSRTSYNRIETEEGHLIEFNLCKSFYRGETADFWFTVRQKRMLCEGDSDIFYDFTPGWFEEIPIDHYRFTWEESANVRSSNADRTEDGLLIWEGKMGYGGHRTMRVAYDAGAFSDADTVTWWSNTKFPEEQAEYQYWLRQMARWSRNLIRILMVLLLVVTIVVREYLSYKKGEGFLGRDQEHRGGTGGGIRGGRGGGGGGCACACACAGCACACACAGGGRAGCSRKDFHTAPEKIPCTLWKKVL